MRKHLLRVTLFFLCMPLVSGSMGCGISKKETSLVKIVGGKMPSPQGPAALSTVVLIRNNAEDDSAMFCSGTLVAPNLVVTAAHCLEGFHSAAQFSVVFGQAERSIDRQIVPVAKFKMFKPEGAKYFPNFDIGWVKLSQPAPQGYLPIEIFHDYRALPYGASSHEVDYLLAGYGLQSTTCEEEDCVGTKLEASTRLREPMYRTSRLFSILVFGNTPGTGSCNGDSGGPAFARIKNKWYLIGATNGATDILNPEVFAADEDQACEVGQSIYTFVGDYAQWIEASSGIKLDHDKSLNPRVPRMNLLENVPPDTGASFADWYAYANHKDPAWYTTDRIVAEVVMRQRPELRLAMFKNPDKVLEALVQNPQLSLEGDSNDDDFATFSQKLRDVRPIATLPLKKLMLRDHAVADYSPLGQLEGLESLTIMHNTKPKKNSPQSYDVSFVNKLTKLRSLDLSDTRGLDVARLDWSKFSSLRELYLDGIGLRDISFLSQLPSLERLSLRHNKISNIATLAALKNLRELYLSGNLIKDKSPLDKLPLLEVIDLPDNGFVGDEQKSAVGVQLDSSVK